MTDRQKKGRIMLISIVSVIYLFFLYYVLQVTLDMDEHPAHTAMEAFTQYGFKRMREAPVSVLPVPGKFFRYGGILTLSFGFAILYSSLNRSMRAHYKNETALGGRRWLMDLDEYNKKFTEPMGKKANDGVNNIILSSGLFLSLNAPRIIGQARNLNVLVIGGSGAGKSFHVAGPNIMQANTSMMITDPSGDLMKQYAPFLESIGYKIRCLNLTHMNRGNHYNPLQYISTDQDIQELVDTFITNTTGEGEQSGEKFWVDSEKNLLIACIAYLVHYCPKKEWKFSEVCRMIRKAKINENDASAISQLDIMFAEKGLKEPEAYPQTAYGNFKAGSGKTLASIVISALSRLHPFDLDTIRGLTDSDDIQIDSIGDERTAIFVIIPTGGGPNNFIASMFYSQFFQRAYRYAEDTARFSKIVKDGDDLVIRTYRASHKGEAKAAEERAEEFIAGLREASIRYNKDMGWYEVVLPNGDIAGYRGSEEMALEWLKKAKEAYIETNKKRLNKGSSMPVHVQLILDEFANIGKIPDFEKMVATMRKYELSVIIILQSLTQLQNMYEKNWGEITGNCDNTVYLGGGADTDTCEWISKLIGKETRVIEGRTLSGNSTSTSLNRQGVEMYSADDLRTMPEDECIVIPKSLNAYKGKKYNSTKHRNWDLVQSFEPYVYDDRRTEYLRQITEAWQPKDEEKADHGQARPESPEEAAQRERKNLAAEKEAEEWKNNQDPETGKPLISEPKDTEEMDTYEDLFTPEDESFDESLTYSGSGKVADGLDSIFRNPGSDGSSSE